MKLKHLSPLMKLLLLICFFSCRSVDAGLLQQTALPLDETAVAFAQGAAKAGLLSKVLGLHEPEVEQLAEEVKSDLGRIIKQAIKAFLERIEDHVNNSKEAADDLFGKAKELRSKLGELGNDDDTKNSKEYKRLIRDKARQALKKIMMKMGEGKRNLDDWMDRIARLRYRDIVERIQDKITSKESIKKIRKSIENLQGEAEWIQKLKQLLKELRDSDIKDILNHLFEYNPFQSKSKGMQAEGWEKFKKFLKELDNKLEKKGKKFAKWVINTWTLGIDSLKEKYTTIKGVAMEFISNSKDKSSGVGRGAMDIFHSHKKDMGNLWDKLEVASWEAIGRF